MNRSFVNIFASNDGALPLSDKERDDKTNKEKFLAKIAIGVIEFLTSSVFLCYGIVFTHGVELNEFTVRIGLWTTVLYYTTWHIAAPWSRYLCEYMEDNGHDSFKYVMIISSFVLFGGLILPSYILGYGILAGLCCNLITTQLQYVATEKFDIELKIFEGNVQTARALSLIVMPHLLLLLIENYTRDQFRLILATFMLNTIPGVLLVRQPKRLKRAVSTLARYQALPTFATQMKEMKEFTNYGNTSDLTHADPETTENDKTDNDILSNNNNTDVALVGELPAPETIQTYYSKAGVSILPGIPEEEECHDEGDINMINPKRLSIISMTLEKLNEKERKNSLKGELEKLNEQECMTEVFDINDVITRGVVDSGERIENIEYIPNYTPNNTRLFKGIKFIKPKSCCCCMQYRQFVWRRRLRTLKDFFIDNFFKPLFSSLTDLYFYPTLISKTSSNLLTVLYITLSPNLLLAKNNDFKMEDTTFFLSYMAFAWCFFLVVLPLVNTFTNDKLRYTYIVGFVLLSSSTLIFTRSKLTNDFVILHCLLFGFGFGITSFTENIVYRTFIGVRRWKVIQGSLDTLSAFLVCFIYYLLRYFEVDIMQGFPFMSSVIYLFDALIWTLAPYVISLLVYLKKYIVGYYENNFI